MDATADEYREALGAAHLHALEWLASTAERPIRPDLDAEGMLGRLRRELPEEGLDAAARDFLAGMTDRYAVRLFEELFIPRPWVEAPRA